MRRAGLTAPLGVVVLLAACGGKSPAQLAVDELNAGLASSGDQALAHFKACVKLDPSNQFCIYDLGVIAHRAGRLSEAENDYRVALTLDPNFPSALFNLALIRAGVGSVDEAIDLYRRLIALRPDEVSGHLQLGLLLRANGKVAEGEQELAKAKLIDPNLVIATFMPEASPTPVEATPVEATPTPK